MRTMCLCAKLKSSSPLIASHTRAEKSADAVAACVAGALRHADHTAPLWPSKVPIQSPVSPLRSMGLPSFEAEIRNTPSSVAVLNCSSTIGREWPWHTSGDCAATIPEGSQSTQKRGERTPSSAG